MSDKSVAVLSQAEVCARPEDGEQPPVAIRECRPRVLRLHSPGAGGAHGGHATPCSARSVPYEYHSPGAGGAHGGHATPCTARSAPYESGFQIRIGSGFNRVSGSGFGIRIRIRNPDPDPGGQK
jgi:hypothetical protein